jgi:hypothetical protein
MRFCVFVAVVFLLISCEKDIDLNLQSADKVLVVDAQIEDEQPPIVVLSKSLSIFSTINAQILSESFVHDADVFVSNGTFTHKLREYPIPLAQGYTAYVYSNDLLSPATSFNGELNKNYTLRIISEGKEYTSSTSIPTNAFSLDSIWLKVAPQNPDTNKRVLYFKATDPIGLGNYGRYFTRINSERFLPGFNSVFDDQIVDGQTFSSQILPGIDRNDIPPLDSNFFKKGDTISLKWCNVSKPTYTFWNTWEFAAQSIGNPFAQPNKVIGNISNGAIGAFCGYAVTTKTLIAK